MRLFRLLLLLYPPGHRQAFSEEMHSILIRRASEEGSRWDLAYARFLLKESAGLLWGGVRERLRLVNAAAVLGGAVCAAVIQLALYSALFHLIGRGATVVERAGILPGDPRAEMLTLEFDTPAWPTSITRFGPPGH